MKMITSTQNVTYVCQANMHQVKAVVNVTTVIQDYTVNLGHNHVEHVKLDTIALVECIRFPAQLVTSQTAQDAVLVWHAPEGVIVKRELPAV